jgi:glutaminase
MGFECNDEKATKGQMALCGSEWKSWRYALRIGIMKKPGWGGAVGSAKRRLNSQEF